MKLKKKWKKGIIIICSILFVINNTEVKVNAESGNRREQIISTGNLQFGDGKVYFTASDFKYLADEIDRLERTYKCNLVEALNAIGTYFLADGSISYDSSQNEIKSEESKAELSFGKIKQGIMLSQSIESLVHTQARNKDGNLLYYANEEGQINKNICEITTVNTEYPVFYQEANAESLSAGTTAWVNGVLIKGNGADNEVFRETGYKEGYEEGQEKGKEEGYIEGYGKGKEEGYAEGQEKGKEEGYIEGHGKGKEEGYAEGYEQGKGQGYGEGYGKGKEEGYAEGYGQGKGQGLEEGKGQGFGEGYGKGKEEGYIEGYGKGKEEGYAEGHGNGYENGYREGYSQGITDGLSKVNVQYTYHTHTGNDSAVGGCYGKCTGYTPEYCSCWGWVSGSYGCDNCHHAFGMHEVGFCTGIVNNRPYEYIGLVCGKTTDTIESATIVY